MPRYLPCKSGASLAIAECPRCHFKVYYADMEKDPNTKMWMCPKCKDQYDPYRLPARKPENITLYHPRKEEGPT